METLQATRNGLARTGGALRARRNELGLWSASGLFLTTDHGATWKDVTPSNAGFGGGEVENHEIRRGRDGTYYLTSYQGIAKSTDGHTCGL